MVIGGKNRTRNIEQSCVLFVPTGSHIVVFMKWLSAIQKSVKWMSSTTVVDRLLIDPPMNNVVQVLEGPSVACHAKRAATALLSGHVIALPTDTLYGIAALAQNNSAVESIYNIKERNSTKPLAICVAEVADVYHWGKVTVPRTLLNSLLPGPVTLIFERTPLLNPALNPGTDSVGIRIPDEEFVRTVVKHCRSPIALTSANISTKESPLCVEEFSELWGKLHSVYDGGCIGEQTECREGSTIIDLSQAGSYRLIRRGIAYKRTVQVLREFQLSLID